MNTTLKEFGRKTAWVLACAVWTIGSHAQLYTYPESLTPEMPHNDDYTVKVRLSGGEWKDLYEYNVQVDLDRVENALMVQFDMGSPVEVMVKKNNGTVQDVKIRPLAADIQHTVNRNTIFFTLDSPRYLSVEVNGDRLHNLHLFANPLKTETYTKDSEHVMYFGPGTHKPQDLPNNQIRIPSNTTVYLAPGAVVKAKLLVDHAENVRIIGRGILDHPGAEQCGYADQDWEPIGIPHSCSMPYFMSKEFYVGYGWYRKTFSLTAEALRKRLFLELDGVFQEAEVFLNGQKVGRHVGGYTGFSIDITSAARKGDNLLAVRVNNLWHPDVAPRAGEHTFSGGIYRNVRLVMKSPAHITWYGVGITTPDLSGNHGTASAVTVCTEVRNRNKKAAKYRLVTEIRDAEGTVVTSTTNTMDIPADSVVTFQQTTPSVQSPRLWSPESPMLYTAVSSLYKGNKLLDRTETPFGFRWVEWTADRGFFLNGEHLYLRGANVHQDHAGWGDAVTEAGTTRHLPAVRRETIRRATQPTATPRPTGRRQKTMPPPNGPWTRKKGWPCARC